MSTKCTLAYSETFSLYYDLLDDDAIYLRLKGASFEASPGEITVEIPLAVWAVIRACGTPDMSLADKTDEEIRQVVEGEVQERIDGAAAARASGRNTFLSLFGLGVYGSVDDPRDKQVSSGIEYMTKQRAKQRELRDEVEKLRKGIST